MGTNYYIKINDCEKCGRYDDIHLGRSSAGWTFSFQYNGGEYYKNVKEMKEWLIGKVIIDEYGDDVTQEAFWKLVEQKQKNKENKCHAEYCKVKYPHMADTELIIDGYSFSDGEFS
mgnify:CR=1 FL=1